MYSSVISWYLGLGIGLILLLVADSGGTCCADEADSRPNVVLIIADDIAWTDYGFMGHEHIQTPSIDRLAKESAVFVRGYVPTALCRPSLATIITGLYAHQHGITGNDPAILARLRGKQAQRDPEYQQLRQRLIAKIDAVETLPRLLGEQGYVSLQTGKWWEGSFQRGGFTHGMTHGDPDRGGRHGDEGLSIGRQGLEPIRRFLDEQRGDNPFFIWYAPFLPHTPHNPPERLLEKYRRDDRPLALAKYYAMCEWFDETCGQLLEILDDRQLRSNTLVVYVADNGWIQRTPDLEVPGEWRNSFAPRSKQSPFEGGIRTPIMLRWPYKIRPGKLDVLASSIDLAPTILSACDMPTSQPLSGIDLIEVSRNRKSARSTIFGESFAHDIADLDDPQASLLFRWCISERWKLLLSVDGATGRYDAVHRHHQQGGPWLYDLIDDPHETRNLVDARTAARQQLQRRLEQWWQ